MFSYLFSAAARASAAVAPERFTETDPIVVGIPAVPRAQSPLVLDEADESFDQATDKLELGLRKRRLADLDAELDRLCKKVKESQPEALPIAIVPMGPEVVPKELGAMDLLEQAVKSTSFEVEIDHPDFLRAALRDSELSEEAIDKRVPRTVHNPFAVNLPVGGRHEEPVLPAATKPATLEPGEPKEFHLSDEEEWDLGDHGFDVGSGDTDGRSISEELEVVWEFPPGDDDQSAEGEEEPSDTAEPVEPVPEPDCDIAPLEPLAELALEVFEAFGEDEFAELDEPAVCESVQDVVQDGDKMSLLLDVM